MKLAAVEFFVGVKLYKWLISVNVVGIVLYLYFASWVWAPVDVKGVPGGPGDAIVWSLSAFPVIVVFFVVDSVWFLLSLFRNKYGNKKVSVAVFFVLCALWFCAHYYDHLRQYDGDKTSPTSVLGAEKLHAISAEGNAELTLLRPSGSVVRVILSQTKDRRLLSQH